MPSRFSTPDFNQKSQKFLTSLIVYISHLNPVFSSQKDRIKFFEMIDNREIYLDPTKYLSTVNDTMIRNYFIEEVFPLLGKKNQIETLIALVNNIPSNIEDNYPMDQCELLKIAVFIIRSISLECSSNLQKEHFEIRPRVVSQFCYNPYQSQVKHMKERDEKKTRIIDQKNSIIDQKNSKIKEMEESLYKLKAQNIAYTEELQSLQKEKNEMKIKLSNNDVRKRNIYELRKRLKSFLEKPGSKLIQDYEELQKKYTELSDGVPFCPITYVHLHQIDGKIMGTRCGHIFSEKAIQSWFEQSENENKKTCPTCRAKLNRKKDVFEIFLANDS